MKKTEIRPGQSAAKIGVLFGAVAIGFGIFWIGLFFHLSGQEGEMEPGVAFLLVFGVMFVVAAVAITVFYAKSAYGKKKPAIVVIEEASGEEGAAGLQAAPAGGSGFCPYCGKAVQEDYSFCRHSGKKIS